VHVDVQGSGGIPPRILNFCSRWMWAISFVPGDTAHGILCVGGLVGPRGSREVVKIRIISCPCRGSNSVPRYSSSPGLYTDSPLSLCSPRDQIPHPYTVLIITYEWTLYRYACLPGMLCVCVSHVWQIWSIAVGKAWMPAVSYMRTAWAHRDFRVACRMLCVP
jgi:hypothetical protein